MESALAWFQSEKVVAQISNRLLLKPKQGFPFLFLKQEGSYNIKLVGLGFTLHKNCNNFYFYFFNFPSYPLDVTWRKNDNMHFGKLGHYVF